MLTPLRNSGRLKATPDAALIVTDYETLHEEQEPVLFTGMNRFGARILGTFVAESIKTRTRRFLHVQVHAGDYAEFIRGKLTYLQILQKVGTAFVVDRRSGRSRRTTIVAKDIDEIPVEYLPTENSLAPPPMIQAGPEYVQKLGGRLGEQHSADPNQLSRLLESVPLLLTGPFEGMNLGYKVRADVVAFQEGSFEVKFALRHEVETEDFPLFPRIIKYPEYAQIHLDFCMNDFTTEAPAIAQGNYFAAPRFVELVDAHRGLRDRLGMPATEPSDPRPVLRTVERSTRALDEMATLIGDDLDSITLLNVADGTRMTVGILDDRSPAALQAALDLIEPITQQLTEDTQERDHDILIYALNKETRHGSAHVVSQSKRQRRSRFAIDPSADLDPFLESFRYSNTLRVKGTAITNSSGQVVRLRIQGAS